MINSRNGFSLVEILVAAAIMTGVSLAFMQLSENQSRGQKSINNRLVINDAYDEIRTILSNPQNCRATIEVADPSFDPRSSSTLDLPGLRLGASYSERDVNLVLEEMESNFGPFGSDTARDQFFFNKRWGERADDGSLVFTPGEVIEDILEIEELTASVININLTDSEQGRVDYRIRVKSKIIDRSHKGAKDLVKDFYVNGIYQKVTGSGNAAEIRIISCSISLNDSDQIVANGCPKVPNNEDIFTIDTFSDPDQCQYNVDNHAEWFNQEGIGTGDTRVITNHNQLLVGMSDTGQGSFGFANAFSGCSAVWDPEQITSDWALESEIDRFRNLNLTKTEWQRWVAEYGSGPRGSFVIGFNPHTGLPICDVLDKVDDTPLASGTPNTVINTSPINGGANPNADPVDPNFKMCAIGQHAIGYDSASNSLICRQDRKFLYELPDSQRDGAVLVTKTLSDGTPFFSFQEISCETSEIADRWAIHALLPSGKAQCNPRAFADSCEEGTYLSSVNNNGSINCSPVPGGLPEGEVDNPNYSDGDTSDDSGIWNNYIVGLETYHVDASGNEIAAPTETTSLTNATIRSRWKTKKFPPRCSVNDEPMFDGTNWSCRNKQPPALSVRHCRAGLVMVGVNSRGVICRELAEYVSPGCSGLARSEVLSDININLTQRSGSTTVEMNCDKIDLAQTTTPSYCTQNFRNAAAAPQNCHTPYIEQGETVTLGFSFRYAGSASGSISFFSDNCSNFTINDVTSCTSITNGRSSCSIRVTYDGSENGARCQLGFDFNDGNGASGRVYSFIDGPPTQQ